MANELATRIDDSALENVLIGGDLSKLTPAQRVQYYKRTCESLGLNPLTRPFDYITLNNKLTLYAKKDATDQLRSIKGVSIDDVDIQDVGDNYIVKVKGHDLNNRSDVEIGVVRKSDMQGNLANVQMKAVTKAKRRLTLSLCGLGWLDETEIETIPDARPVSVQEDGVIEAEAIERKEPPAPTESRPYSPTALNARLKVMADSLTGQTCTDGQRKSIRINLTTLAGGDANYPMYLEYLTGFTSSTDMPDNWVLAVSKWLGVHKDADGQWVIDDMALREGKAVFDEVFGE